LVFSIQLKNLSNPSEDVKFQTSEDAKLHGKLSFCVATEYVCLVWLVWLVWSVRLARLAPQYRCMHVI
jgi:hypothetical protein